MIDSPLTERVERLPGDDAAAAQDGGQHTLARELVAGSEALLGNEPSQARLGRLGVGRRDEEIESRLPM